METLSKNKTSRLRALRSKKNREKYGQCVAEGSKMVMELLDSFSDYVEFVVLDNTFLDTDQEKLGFRQTYVVERDLFRELSNQSNPEGILCVVDTEIFKSEDRGDFIVYLDGIRDPGNLGTIIRTCDWFGVGKLLLSNDTVDITNEKVIQASMGSIWRQPIEYISIEEAIRDYASHTVYAARMEGSSLKRENQFQDDKAFLVLGSESHGIRYENKKMKSISIPAYGKSEMESLNVSIASAILIAWHQIK